MIVLIDCYDSFSYNLQALVRSLGAKCTVIRVDQLLDIDLVQNISGVILSPGPGEPDDYPELQSYFDRNHNQLPFLGVCLGHQLIGSFFGLRLTKLGYPIHGKIRRVIQTVNHPMFNHLPQQFQVTRYHSLVLEKEASPYLVTTALDAEEGWPMAFAHKVLPIWGVQYHPEAYCTEFGSELLANWLNFTKERT